jgi:hypothetical protein
MKVALALGMSLKGTMQIAIEGGVSDRRWRRKAEEKAIEKPKAPPGFWGRFEVII